MIRAEELNRLYHRFNDRAWLKLDPLGMIDRDLAPADFELLSFICAGLSYGRVEQIRKSFSNLLARLAELGLESNGAGLAGFLKSSNSHFDEELGEVLKGWKHRLNTSSDIFLVLKTMARVLETRGSLCKVFQNSYQVSPKDHISAFCDELKNLSDQNISKLPSTWEGTGLSWFASSPKDGSTCKRLLMWLRWMIRKDSIDPGIWQLDEMSDEFLPAPSASRLFVPVDAHILSWAYENGLIKSNKNPNWKTTEAITQFFLSLNPEDPLRYDFAICHAGMADFRELNEREFLSSNL